MFKNESLMTAAFEPAQLSRDKPILFIDIDGVLNPLPYERVWVGPESSAANTNLRDPKNWEWVKLPLDPEQHFPITREIDLEFDRWADRSAEYKKYLAETSSTGQYRSLRICVSDVMLSEMRDIIAQFDLQVVYLTYWRSEALRLLEPEVRLGAESFLEWDINSDLGHRAKIDAILNLFERENLRNRFVVIDDEALKGLNSSNNLWPTNTANQMYAELNAVPKMLIQPDARWGIEPKHLRDLRSFLSVIE